MSQVDESTTDNHRDAAKRMTHIRNWRENVSLA